MKNFDDVNGFVFGGNYGQCWVTYEGRKQGNTEHPYDKAEAERFCMSIVGRIKAECDEVFSMIYPNQDGWKFHFDGV